MESTLITTNNRDCLKLIIEGNKIKFANLPKFLTESEVLVSLKDKYGNVSNKVVFTRNSYPFYYVLPRYYHGVYSLNIYAKRIGNTKFWSYHDTGEILLLCDDTNAKFCKSPIQKVNEYYLSLFPQKVTEINSYLKPSNNVQSDNHSIIRATKQIVNNVCLNYLKVKRIHDWIASNVYYDYDVINNGSYLNNDNSALNTLFTRRGICQGYANLTVAMLRAVKIPAFVLSCFSLGESAHGGWENNANVQHDPNHVISAAFVDSRWVLIDTTWDSDNKIKNGVRYQQTKWGCIHKYFDITLDFLSSTHKVARIKD